MAHFEHSKARRAERWFDVRGRKVGMWAYALNRITGLGLVVYLYLHLVILSQLLGWATSWDSFVSLARSPFFLMLDVVLIAGALIHGLNGLCVALMGFGVKANKAIFAALMFVAAMAVFAAALLIYEG